MKDDHGSFPAWVERVSNIRGVACVYVFYGMLHALVTRIPGPTLALDDVKLNVDTQSLQAGYLPGNPPLYEWLLIAAQQLAGPSLIAVLLVKYALIAAAGLTAYLLAIEITKDRRWAAVTSFSLVLFYQFGWNAHQAFTHTLALIPATLFFWWTLLRLFQRQQFIDYLLLGVSLSLGVLSKYSFIGVAAAAFVAVMLRPESRKALAFPRLIFSLLFALLITSPHLYWLITQNNNVIEASATRLQGANDPYWQRVLEGVPAAIWSIASFFLPFALVTAALFRQSFSAGAATNIKALIARDAALIGAGAIILGVIVLGISGLQERYTIAFLLPALFWAIVKIRDSAFQTKVISRYVSIVVLAAIFMLGLRFVQTAIPGEPFCSDCRQWVPYDVIAESLDIAGFENGTLVGFTDHTAGNLRRLFPRARVISSHMPFYTPPGGRLEDDCYFIWSEDLGPPVAEAVTGRFDATSTYKAIGQWRHFARETGWRTTTWTIARVSHDSDLTKSLCRPAVLE